VPFFRAERREAKWLAVYMLLSPICLEWAAGLEKKECRPGIEPLLGIIPLMIRGTLTGSPEDLECFQTFLKTLN